MSSGAATRFPKKDTLATVIEEQGNHLLAMARTRVNGKKKFLSCDRENKGVCCATKMILFWHAIRVPTLLLDSDVAEGTVLSAASTVNSS